MNGEGARRHHDSIDPHGRAWWLRDALLGGQDGIVNVLGVVLGVAAATESRHIVFVAGLAAALAESISMAAVAYTSSRAASERYASERSREYRHIAAVPEIERDEIRAIYARKGFRGDLLERIVATITSNADVWVAVMMAEEHGLGELPPGASLRSAALVGAASLVGSLLPLAPFVVAGAAVGSALSVLLAGVVLFAFGAYKARLTVGRPLRAGLELAAIGLASAFVGYGVGRLAR